MTGADLFSKSLLISITLILFVGLTLQMKGQVTDDFSDGDFTTNPAWMGDTASFQITNSSAVPPEMKPALQLDGSGADTSILYLPNTSIDNTEWQFWIKLSFNTSANNFARVYLVSDQPDLKGLLNGYFLQVGGANDSIGLYKQQGTSTELILDGAFAFTGNTTNDFRIRITRDNSGFWQLYTDPDGGTNFISEGNAFDNSINSTAWFGIFCKYTSSNATKFYFDDFLVGEIIVDTISPSVSNVQVLSSNSLNLYFDEPVDPVTANEEMNYTVDGGIGNPASATRDATNHSLVLLEFASDFEASFPYQLTVGGIADLSGNVMSSESVGFEYTIPSGFGQGAILIDEIMADENPVPTGLPESDWLELYNPSTAPVDLAGCTLQPRESASPVVFPHKIILPDSFLIVCHNSDTALFTTYGPVTGMSGFSLNNEGTAVLRDPYGNLIHAVSYTTDWYNDADKEDGGWSLEMTDLTKPCSGIENWMASIDPAGGTPGRRNSNNGFTYSVPEIIGTEVIGLNSVKLFFSHDMDSLSITDPQSYFIAEASSSPIHVSTGEIHFNYALLEFDFNLEENKEYQLQLTDTLFNCAGDFIEAETIVTVVRPSQADPFDVVINEIMPDPTPPVGLPEYEYIEVFNSTDRFLEVYGWTLEVDDVVKTVPDFVLGPEEYVILTTDDAVWLFSYFARSFGFSSLGLTNSGAELKLVNQEGKLVSIVTYSNDWFEDAVKSEGGWSLEQIDPFNPCAGSENWKASENDAGGTPGELNSIDASNPVGPGILSIIPEDDQSFNLIFNQLMDKSSILNPGAYSVDNTIGNPTEVTLVDSAATTILLHFDVAFLKQQIYTLSIEEPVYNCKGTEMPIGSSFPFGISEMADRNDVVINEVLFNPAGDGADFVEIYNRSQKIIDLKTLKLGEVNTDDLGLEDTTYKTVTVDDQLLLHGQYIVLTNNPTKVKQQYFTENPEGFIKMSSFPTYSNDEGRVVLSGQDHQLIDYFAYNEAMHYPLLHDVEGVSLERINYDRPSYDETNWHSASGAVGFATPAYKNSQFSDSKSSDDAITTEPEIFSPDNDGYHDVLNIHYRFEEPGYMASIVIYDAQGRLTQRLVNNELLGTEGIFSWDGRTLDNQKASIGTYVIYVEVFDLQGHVMKFKKAAVLGGKL